MTNIQIFQNSEFGDMRITDQNGQEWYCAADVCRACGIANSRDAVSRLDEDEKRRVSEIPTPSGKQEMTFVSEAGLYALVLTSTKPEAKAFKRWITHEVIPQIRKTGGYSAKTLSGDELILAAVTELQSRVANLSRTVAVQQAQIEADKPKVIFSEAVATSNTDILVGELAKILYQNGFVIGQNRLFERLRNEGYLCKTGSAYNCPTQRAMDMGLFRIKETAITHSDGHVTIQRTTKVTGRGQVYLVNKFLGKGAAQ